MKNLEFTMKPSDDGSEPYIELNKLLKALRLVESGAMACQWVEDGVVKVNGMVETRKRAKLRTDDVVEIPGYQIKIN